MSGWLLHNIGGQKAERLAVYRTYCAKVPLIHGKYSIDAKALGYGHHRGIAENTKINQYIDQQLAATDSTFRVYLEQLNKTDAKVDVYLTDLSKRLITPARYLSRRENRS